MEHNWNNSSMYELYIGRWSRPVVIEFLKWFDQPEGLKWVDIGCGTGALSDAIIKMNQPAVIICADKSETFLISAAQNLNNDNRVSFLISQADNLDIADGEADVIVSGFVLNFLNDHNKALKEFRRVLKDKGVIGAYVWDYAGKMEMMRYFWDSAVSLFEDACEQDEGIRSPICNLNALEHLFKEAGFIDIETCNIDIPTIFRDFDDYWLPLQSGLGTAAGYCASLDEISREKLKDKIHSSLPIENDGSIHLIARAIAIKAKS